ncbi:MAG TPA: porin family protein [Bryobacteraceae bacterium]|nr:porin family protein [Bryobacteraceae bacterium]
MTFSVVSRFALCACLLAGFSLFAQDDDSGPAVKRPSIGVRAEYFGSRFFKTAAATEHTTAPIADYNFSAWAGTGKFAIAPTLEYRLTKRLSLGAEMQFHYAEYSQTTQIRTGLVNPNSSVDDRKVTTLLDSTKADYWDVPLLAHYYGLRKKGLLTKSYLSAGLELRHVGRVRTGNEITNADGTTAYNENPDSPRHTNDYGLVVGLGLRWVDDFKVKVAPEIRYIRWQGSTFEGPAFRSQVNEIQGGLGISF